MSVAVTVTCDACEYRKKGNFRTYEEAIKAAWDDGWWLGVRATECPACVAKGPAAIIIPKPQERP